jgi:threonine 3-dehydrogenase
MIAMLQNGLDISEIITNRFGIDSFKDGFSTMKSGQCGKVILDWT